MIIEIISTVAMRHYLLFLLSLFLMLESNRSFGQSESEKTEFLGWDCIVTGYRPNVYYPGHGAYDILLQRVSYWRDNIMIWKQEVPERMKVMTGFYVLGIEGSYKPGDTIRAIGRGTEPYLIDFYLCEDAFLSNEIGVSYRSGFLLWDKKDGRLLIEQPYPAFQEIEDHYFTPETDILIHSSNSECSLKSMCRWGEFTAKCGDCLFHYNGYLLFVYQQNKLVNTQKGKVKRTPTEKFTIFKHRNYKIYQQARKRELE